MTAKEESINKVITRLKSKVFSLERLWTLKSDFGPFSFKERVKCVV